MKVHCVASGKVLRKAESPNCDGERGQHLLACRGAGSCDTVHISDESVSLEFSFWPLVHGILIIHRLIKSGSDTSFASCSSIDSIR